MMRKVYRPESTPRPSTWIGRHFETIQWLESYFAQKKPLRTVKALVVGFGGGKEGEDESTHIQHLEAALLLHRTNCPFRLVAMDPNPEAVAMAKKALAEGVITFEHKRPPASLFSGREYDRRVQLESYLAKVSGMPEPLTDTIRIPLPSNVQKNVRIQGPKMAGDIMKEGAPRNNDLVFCTNLSQYFSQKTQPHLAARLFHATGPGGCLSSKVRI